MASKTGKRVLAVVLAMLLCACAFPALAVAASQMPEGNFSNAEEPAYVSSPNGPTIYCFGTPVILKEVGGVTQMFKASDPNTALLNGDDISGCYIYGGWNGLDHVGDTSIVIESGTFRQMIRAGGAYGVLDGSTSVTIHGGTFYGNIVGGAFGSTPSDAITGNINVHITGGTFYCGTISGGGNGELVQGNVNLLIEGGVFLEPGYFDIIGGAAGRGVEGDVNIHIKGGTFPPYTRVMGDSKVGGDVNITIETGRGWRVEAGSGANIDGNVTINLTGGDFSNGRIRSGVYSTAGTYAVAGDSTLNIYPNANITGIVFESDNISGTYTRNYFNSLTLNANGGTGAAPTPAFYAAIPANPFTAPAGRPFTAWNTAVNGSGTAYTPGQKFTACAVLTLHAQWEALPTYAVAVTNGTADKATAAAGETVTITANTPPAGQRFKQWNISQAVSFTGGTNANSATAKFIMPAGNVTAMAEYENIPGGGSQPPAKGIFGTNARYTQWWCYILFFLCFGFIWMWF